MKHLGDITKINGADIEPVWCITGGSPCQDLSVAGGARSGLFMEQVRIVKEMREHDRQNGRTGDMVRPRYLVWENVPGAFSSNFKDGFGDFGAVLEEIVRIAEPTFSLPRLEGKQKWTKAGAIDGDGWSVAWRTHDAQYWGVPQRRRRISVVADFGGQCAGEILFECESVSGDIEPGKQTRKEAAGDFGDGAAVNDRVAFGIDGRNAKVNEEISGTLQSKPNGGFSYNCVNPVAYTMQAIGQYKGGDVASSCKQRDYKDATDLVVEKKCYGICSYASNSMMSDNPNSGIYEAGTSRTLDLNGGNPACNQGGVAVCEPCVYDMTHSNDVIRDCGGTSPTLQNRMGTGGNQVPLTVERIIRWIVRRLTPLERTRLQGFPDGWVEIGEWTDSKGKKHKDADSPKYKALGNSIAIPFWLWLTRRMASYLPEGATLGSLFDGIGGFPLCWEAIHGKGTARWASEIEEFPIAVTKMRFGED